jgi:predicted transcriptional regulator
MVNKPTPTGIFARVPPAVKRRLEKLAAENRRSVGAEAALAIEAHLANAEKEKTA